MAEIPSEGVALVAANNKLTVYLDGALVFTSDANLPVEAVNALIGQWVNENAQVLASLVQPFLPLPPASLTEEQVIDLIKKVSPPVDLQKLVDTIDTDPDFLKNALTAILAKLNA